MGTGFFSESTMTFNLRVSFRYQAISNQTQLEEWRTVFSWASQMLYMATEGQMRIGSIDYVHNETAQSNEADIYIECSNPGGLCAAVHTSPQLGLGKLTGGHIRIDRDTISAHPGRLVHELGHYAFDLYEEYQDEFGNASSCVPTESGACIMELGGNSIDLTSSTPAWPLAGFPLVTEFCQHNHATAAHQHRMTSPRTQQQKEHGKDCWRTMKDEFAVLTLPATSVENVEHGDPVPGPIPPVTMRGLAPSSKFVLALDRSGSMSLNAAIEGVKQAAHAWIDLEVLLGNQLGIVSYAGAATEEFNPRVINHPATFEHGRVNLLNTSRPDAGSTNISAALAEAETSIGTDVARRRILLFSDGNHNTGGIGPVARAQQIRGDGTPIHTLSFGSAADIPTMIAIAGPYGEHEHVEHPANSDHTAFEINHALSMLAKDVHSSALAHGRALLQPSPVDDDIGIEAVEKLERDALHDLAGMSDAEIARRGHMFCLPVNIEEGMSQATFVANFRPGDTMLLWVRDPDLDPLVPSPANFGAGEGHATYSVSNPKPGDWLMCIVRLRGQREDLAPVGLFAFGENHGLTPILIGHHGIFAVGDSANLRAGVQYPGLLTNLRVRVWPEDDPDGFVEFVESGKPGQYVRELPPFEQSGSHTYVLEYVADGETVEAQSPLDSDEGRPIPEPNRPGPFRRIKRFQMHVGPLQEGFDNDAGAGGGCCERLSRWVNELCRRLCGAVTRIWRPLRQRVRR